MLRKINENYLCILVYTCTCIRVVLRRKQPMISDAFMQFDESASDDTTKYGVLMLRFFLTKLFKNKDGKFKDRVGVRAKSFI